MRVALVADPYVPVPPEKYGGTEQVIDNLIKGLIEQGHEPILFGPGDSTVDCELVPTVRRSVSFSASKGDRLNHKRKLKIIARNTEALLRKNLHRVDIIHSHSQVESAFDIRKFRHFPNVTTMHNPVNFHDIEYYAKRQEVPYVSISKNQQEAFPYLSYVSVVYNGEDPSRFPIVHEPEEYVCFLGRFDRTKNPHLAILLAISAGIPIKVAGKIDHDSEGYFEEEIEPYLSHPLVEYLGELGFEDKVELLSKAKCNLHPTGFREPFGLTVIEAAYCGTPTLAIRRGAVPELIEDGRTGALVEDFIEGFSRLEECFGMDRVYVAKRARSLFNYKVMAENYIRAYEVVIEMYAEKAKRSRGFGLESPLRQGWSSFPVLGSRPAPSMLHGISRKPSLISRLSSGKR